MTDWGLISTVPVEWRETFITWASNGIIETRAQVTYEDRYDREQIMVAQLRYMRPNEDNSPEDWPSILATIPIHRSEALCKAVSPIVWRNVEFGSLTWESASFSAGSGDQAVNDFLIGIEFDLSSAAAQTIPVVGGSLIEPKDAVSKSGRKSGAGGAPIAATALDLFDLPPDQADRSGVESVKAMLKAAYETRNITPPHDDNLRKEASGIRNEVRKRRGFQ